MTSIRFQTVRDDPVRHPWDLSGSEEPADAAFGSVMLVPRRIPGGVAATLDGLGAEALPRLRHEGSVASLRRALRATLGERLPRPRWLANWLLDDVLDQAALMARLTGTSTLLVALDVENGEQDAPFAVADAPLRLVTSYRGPGVAWLPPATAGIWRTGLDLAAVSRDLPRGHVAILRGRSGAGAGVPHRAAIGDGAAPLRLIIEAAGRAAPAARRRASLQPPNNLISTASQSRST